MKERRAAAELHHLGGVAVFSAWSPAAPDGKFSVTVHPMRDGSSGYVWVLHKSRLPRDVCSARVDGGKDQELRAAIDAAISRLLEVASPQRTEKDDA